MPTIDNMLLIPVLEPGDKLFHYTSAEGLLGICNQEFWVTESNFLNDFTEFHVATDIFCEMLEKHMKNKSVCDKLKTKVCEELIRISSPGKLGESVAYSGNYVISFCLDNDSTLMWSEYSDFLGYCMKFDFQKLLDSFSKPNTVLHGKVIYDHDEQLRLLETAFENEFIHWPTGYDYLQSWEDLDCLTDEDIEDFYFLVAVLIEGFNMFFKKPCFSGEHEYRFVFFCGHDGGRYKPEDLQEQYFRVKDEVLIPYVKQKMSSLDSLEAVLIGPKNKSDIAVKGLEYFFRNKKLDVKVEKSQMPLRY